MFVLEEGILEDSEIFFFQPSGFAHTALFGLQHIGIFHCDERYTVTHPYWESILLILIDSGQLEVAYGGKNFIACKGDAVMIDCRNAHRYTARSELRFHYFHFDGHSSAPYCALLHDLYGSALLKGVYGELELNIFNNMMRYVRSRITRDNEHRISVYIHMILCNLVEARAKMQPGTEQYMEQVIAYMQEHLSENLSVDEMAAAAGLSKYYFIRLFTKQTGFSPHRYFNNMRIQKARFLLHTTDESVEAVSAACGFENPSNFIRLFRSYTGMTPAVFRKIPF